MEQSPWIALVIVPLAFGVSFLMSKWTSKYTKGPSRAKKFGDVKSNKKK